MVYVHACICERPHARSCLWKPKRIPCILYHSPPYSSPCPHISCAGTQACALLAFYRVLEMQTQVLTLTLKDSTYNTISSGLRQDLARPPQLVSLGKWAGFLYHSLELHISLNLHSFVKTSETQTIFQSEFIYLCLGLAVQPRAGLEPSILMHQTPDFCDFRCVPQHSAFKNLSIRDYYIYL